MKGDRLDVITLVNVNFCGLKVPDGAKGALLADNVAAFKRLEKPCAKARRAQSEEDYAASHPIRLVQISPITSRGFKPEGKQHTHPKHTAKQQQLEVTGTERSVSPQDANTGEAPNRQTQATVASDDASSAIRAISTTPTLDFSDSIGSEHHVAHKRRTGVWDIIPKTQDDVVLMKPMDEINYMDPLGPENGYPDWQHR